MALLLIVITTLLHLSDSFIVNASVSDTPHEATSRVISDLSKSYSTSEVSSTIATATVESIASNSSSADKSKNGTTCKADEFTCVASSTCVPLFKKCDRHNDCGDWSDESDCDIVCANQTQVMCDPSFNASFNVSSSYSSVSPFPGCYSLIKERCDGVFHCDNGADEKGCHGCPFNMYVCRNGKSCYSDANRCNGIADCTDFTDEINCGFCPVNQTLCDPSTSLTACYDPIKDRCNRILDCSSGIDEKNCVGGCDGKISCSLGSGCYSPEERCNGMPDCSDYSDEKNCTASLCRPDHGSFLCANRRCIRADWVCDRSNDCGDASDEINCLKNSVITAAIMGSLVCGLLLVIAISCTCKLIALRQAEAAREHEQSASGHRNGFSSYHRSDATSSCPRSLASLFDSDQPFFRIEPDPYFYREPPPSYAASVCTANGLTSINSAGSLLLSGNGTGASLSCDSYDRNSRRTRRIRRHQRRRPPSPPNARTTPSDATVAANLISSSNTCNDSHGDNGTAITPVSDGASLNPPSTPLTNSECNETTHSLSICPLLDPLQHNGCNTLPSIQMAEKTTAHSTVSSQKCDDAKKPVNTSHTSHASSKVSTSSSSTNHLPGQAKATSRTPARSLLTVIAGSGSSTDAASGAHANHSSNRLYQFKKQDDEVSPILDDVHQEYNEEDEYQSPQVTHPSVHCDPVNRESSKKDIKCTSIRQNRGKSHLFSSPPSHDQACTLLPLTMVSCPIASSHRTAATGSVSSSAASSLNTDDSDKMNNTRTGEGDCVTISRSHSLKCRTDSSKGRVTLSTTHCDHTLTSSASSSVDLSSEITKPCDQIELDSLMTVTATSPSSHTDCDEEPLLR